MACNGHPKPRHYKAWGARVLATNLERRYRRAERRFEKRSRRVAALTVRPFPSVATADWGDIAIRPVTSSEMAAIKAEMDRHVIPIADYYADKVMTPFGLATRQPNGDVVLDVVPEPSQVIMALAATRQPPLSPEDLTALEAEYDAQQGVFTARGSYGFGTEAVIERIQAALTRSGEMQRGIDDMRSMPHGLSFRGFFSNVEVMGPKPDDRIRLRFTSPEGGVVEQLKDDIEAGRVSFEPYDVTPFGEGNRERYKPEADDR